jgi:hypothetical protein
MTEPNISLHAAILRQHGRDVLKTLRKVENISMKIARWTNHRIFNIRCAKVDIVPRSIKLKSAVTGTKADQIIHKTERQLLDIRIRNCSFTVSKLQDDLQNLESVLFSAIEETKHPEVKQHILRMRTNEFENVKDKQRDKFAKLVVAKHEREREIQQDGSDIDQNRWVVNKSDKVLNANEQSVLRKGLNFAVTPKELPTKDYIVSTEIACRNLPAAKAQSLRSEVVKCVRKAKPPKSNIKSSERKALFELKKDKNIIILPADKGRATVVLNTSDYESKMNELLSDPNTYQKLDKDPTKAYQTQLVEMIRRWQREDQLTNELKYKIYPTAAEVPKIYGTPKIHKANAPLRPIVSSIGSITYKAARLIADILNPLVGNTEHHITNSGDFVDKIKDLEVPPGQKLVSYDVSALFTSIPVPEAIAAVKEKLDRDANLSERTPLSSDQILELLTFCLNTTYFMYNGQFYKQTHGAAMGSPVSPIVANIYMEKFEARALATAANPPSIWYRYVDDTFVRTHEYNIDEFTTHINSLDPNIKFTIEPEQDGKLPFLDTCIHVNEDGSTRVTIYRKPTHTDQYLNFDSNHHLQHKRSVVRTLTDRIGKLVTTEDDKQHELNHVKSALKANGYKPWMMKAPKPKKKTNNKETGDQGHRISVPLPYVKGVSEKLTNIFRDHGVNAYHKPMNTIRSMLVHPKDKTPDSNKCGVIYKISCPECEDTYIGETSRAMDVRLKEHQRTRGKTPPTAVGDHIKKHDHDIDMDHVQIIGREEQFWNRKIREAIEIKTQHPSLNRDSGYELAAIYDDLLALDHSTGGQVTGGI